MFEPRLKVLVQAKSCVNDLIMWKEACLIRMPLIVLKLQAISRRPRKLATIPAKPCSCRQRKYGFFLSLCQRRKISQWHPRPAPLKMLFVACLVVYV